MDEIETTSNLDSGDAESMDDGAQRLATDKQCGSDTFGDGSVRF